MTLNKKYFIGIAVLLSIQTLFAADIKVTSQRIKQNGTIANEQVFSGFGCKGLNLSPDLSWSGAPKETKYFAITVYDLDAPTGSGWWHWTVFNIPSDVNTIPPRAGNDPSLLPKGSMQSRTDFGKPGYGGPCPPARDKAHRYHFKVYALKDKIDLDSEASGALLGFYIHNLKIAEGLLIGKYGR